MGQQAVAAVDALCDLAARLKKGQVALAIHRDITVLPQLLHGNADAGLGIAQLVDHVDGAHTAHPLGQHKDSLEIIFCGLVDLHVIGLLPRKFPVRGTQAFRSGLL